MTAEKMLDKSVLWKTDCGNLRLDRAPRTRQQEENKKMKGAKCVLMERKVRLNLLGTP